MDFKPREETVQFKSKIDTICILLFGISVVVFMLATFVGSI